MKMKRVLTVFFMLAMALHLSGCGLLWFGAGAATGSAIQSNADKK